MSIKRLATLLTIAGVAGLGSVPLAAGMDQGAAPERPDWVAQGDWAEVRADAEGSLWFVDRGASDFTAWPLRVIARAQHPAGHHRYEWTQREMEIDCDRHGYRILRTLHRDRAGRTSEVDERGDGAFRSTEPESGPEWVTRFVCQGPGSLPGHVWPPEMVRNSM
jgi:hypothetical protein